MGDAIEKSGTSRITSFPVWFLLLNSTNFLSLNVAWLPVLLPRWPESFLFLFPPVKILQLFYTIFQDYVGGWWHPVCWLAQFCQCTFVDPITSRLVHPYSNGNIHKFNCTFQDIHFFPISNNRKLNDRVFSIIIDKLLLLLL